ncbi:MAG: hypothetical protein V4550_19340 [Gemmatimonadota bacterium]
MRTFDWSCDVRQGYDLTPGAQTVFGYITAMTIADTELLPDQTIAKDPMGSSPVGAVAVLSEVILVTGPTGSLRFQGRVSLANQQSIDALAVSIQGEVPVAFTFDVYDYDALTKRYFKSATSVDATTLHGTLAESQGVPALSVGSEPSDDVQSPLNYVFAIGINAKPEDQAVIVAFTATNSAPFPWGDQS